MKKQVIYLSLLLIFLLTAGASAHDWYDAACCAGKDCHPITCESLVEHGKSLFYKAYEFSGSMIKPSQDGQCHVCIINEDSTAKWGPSPHPMCVYIQQGS